ncbi:MAG: dethiobiotin synthase [Deltaproteobacteria bacterium]|nr:dethiobiotin synthase [Deltaproteobacteria bacterium]MBN2671869.1 dethiobiotin synthase [Deltaproteobacteria bacterium]
MNRTFFITGTGTDVGKTVVTRGIVRALADSGLSVVAQKPVESGVPTVNGERRPHDGTALLAASLANRTLAQTCRYLFTAPVSPHLAARLEHRTIDVNEIVSFVTAPHDECDVRVVEGAGGLLVPVTDDTLYADVIAKVDCRLIIVAPDILGTINATLLTIEAARSRKVDVAGVILNQSGDESLKNAEAIAAFGGVPILGRFPKVTASDDAHLAEAARRTLDLSVFGLRSDAFV